MNIAMNRKSTALVILAKAKARNGEIKYKIICKTEIILAIFNTYLTFLNCLLLHHNLIDKIQAPF